MVCETKLSLLIVEKYKLPYVFKGYINYFCFLLKTYDLSFLDN